MKRKLLTIALLTTAMAMNAALKIDRIDPTDWYVGMKNPSLQLMVYGKDVSKAEVKTDYPGVRIDSIVKLDSPNYLLVYLNLSGAQPGEMTLNFSGKKVKYQLKRRDKRGDEHMGFIKFGSRVDVYLPVGTEVCVKLGQKTTGNETILAKLQ